MGNEFLGGISEVPFEIKCKTFYQTLKKYAPYLDMKIQKQLLDLNACKHKYIPRRAQNPCEGAVCLVTKQLSYTGVRCVNSPKPQHIVGVISPTLTWRLTCHKH